MKSFIAIAKELLIIDGVKFLLSEKFTQDPLEEYFGRQRRKGGSSEQPSYFSFQHNDLTLHVVDSDLITDIRGNTRGRDQGQPKIDVHDMRKLSTKSKKR